MYSLARAIACLLFLTAPISQREAWAFELRGDGLVGWIGAWTPGVCEVQRREALEAN